MSLSYGYLGDVNNTIGLGSAYPQGRSYGSAAPTATRSAFRNNSAGQLNSVNQSPVPAGNAQEDVPPASNGIMGKPSSWWLMFFVTMVAFLYLSKRFAGGTDVSFSNIRVNVYNGLFMTFWIVLILNLLKVFATRFKIPGFSELILAA